MSKQDESKKTEDMDVYISTEKAAEILDVTSQTIRRMIQRGELSAIEVEYGNKTFYAIRKGDVVDAEKRPVGRPPIEN